MKNLSVLIAFISIVLFTTLSIAQTNAGKENTQLVYPSRSKMGKMPSDKEKLLLSLYAPQVKDKLFQLKSLNINSYYQALWELPVYLPEDYKNKNNKLLNDIVISVGQESTAEINKDLLELDIKILAAKLKASNEVSKNKIKDDLTIKLKELFDIQVTSKQKRIIDLTAKLEFMKQTLDTVMKNEGEIIKAKLNEMLE